MLARPPYPKHTEEIGMEDMIRLLAAELGQKPQHVEAVVRLLDEGNTIPLHCPLPQGAARRNG